MNDCIFCKIVKKELPSHIIYEDEDIIAFLDIEPINPGHVLIIPKAHLLDMDELSDALLMKIMGLAKRLVIILRKVFHNPGYSIMQNGGIFNDIGHFHLHVFPRYPQDGFSWQFGNIEDHHLDTIKNLIKTAL